MTNTTLHISQELEFLAKALEVSLHPAWQGSIDEKSSITLLQDKPAMTYLLRQDSKGEYDFWISHKKFSGEIYHRHFTLRLFPDGWFFVNTKAPSCESLSTFIQGALVCED